MHLSQIQKGVIWSVAGVRLQGLAPSVGSRIDEQHETYNLPRHAHDCNIGTSKRFITFLTLWQMTDHGTMVLSMLLYRSYHPTMTPVADHAFWHPMWDLYDLICLSGCRYKEGSSEVLKDCSNKEYSVAGTNTFDTGMPWEGPWLIRKSLQVAPILVGNSTDLGVISEAWCCHRVDSVWCTSPAMLLGQLRIVLCYCRGDDYSLRAISLSAMVRRCRIIMSLVQLLETSSTHNSQ